MHIGIINASMHKKCLCALDFMRPCIVPGRSRSILEKASPTRPKRKWLSNPLAHIIMPIVEDRSHPPKKRSFAMKPIVVTLTLKRLLLFGLPILAVFGVLFAYGASEHRRYDSSYDVFSPKALTKIRKSPIPIVPSPSRSNRASYPASP